MFPELYQVDSYISFPQDSHFKAVFQWYYCSDLIFPIPLQTFWVYLPYCHEWCVHKNFEQRQLLHLLAFPSHLFLYHLQACPFIFIYKSSQIAPYFLCFYEYHWTLGSAFFDSCICTAIPISNKWIVPDIIHLYRHLIHLQEKYHS